MAGFFQCFRANTAPLQSLLLEIPRGDEVFDRLTNIFDATTPIMDGERTDLYCVVRKPIIADASELKSLATKLLGNWRDMAIQENDQELVDELTPLPEVRVSGECAPEVDPNDYDSLDVYIYDTHTDWKCGLTSICKHAHWMREAFYYLNCDYYLAGYAMWPWYRDSSELDEPYFPYYKLWTYGAVLRCISRDDVTLYVRQNPNAA